jgi:hypothetical protein
MRPGWLSVAALAAALAPSSAHAQSAARYRDFRLGADLATISALAGLPQSEARVIHQRPAVVTRLDWRPRYYTSGSKMTENDPVQEVVFGFYDDQLFRVSVQYSRERTNGLTDADMIDAVSAEYGISSTLVAGAQPTWGWGADIDTGRPVAQWNAGECFVVLYRSPYGFGYGLEVTSPRLARLARTAIAEAKRMDEREAPERDIERQQKESADTRASQEKARTANKAGFRP